ncbi:MAG: flagellar assembly protein FliH [Pseudomonadota bacterium]|jgi:flagellar biosynthesis/type III secretory pathway protein FliH
MASDFTRINSEKLKKVVDGESDLGRVVRPYQQKPIQEGSFRPVQRDRMVLSENPTLKDSRFKVSELARPYLSVFQEEQAVIADEVRKQVDALAKETYEAALKKGLEEGRVAGAAEAREHVLAEARPTLDSLESLLHEFEGLKAAVFSSNERFLIELVLRISKRICLKELATDSEYVTRLARAMIENCGLRENLRIRVNPTQVDSMGQMRESLRTMLGELKNLQIELSDEVASGACELETDYSTLRASLDSQIDAIHEALVNG